MDSAQDILFRALQENDVAGVRKALSLEPATHLQLLWNPSQGCLQPAWKLFSAENAAASIELTKAFVKEPSLCALAVRNLEQATSTTCSADDLYGVARLLAEHSSRISLCNVLGRIVDSEELSPDQLTDLLALKPKQTRETTNTSVTDVSLLQRLVRKPTTKHLRCLSTVVAHALPGVFPAEVEPNRRKHVARAVFDGLRRADDTFESLLRIGAASLVQLIKSDVCYAARRLKPLANDFVNIHLDGESGYVTVGQLLLQSAQNADELTELVNIVGDNLDFDKRDSFGRTTTSSIVRSVDFGQRPLPEVLVPGMTNQQEHADDAIVIACRHQTSAGVLQLLRQVKAADPNWTFQPEHLLEIVRRTEPFDTTALRRTLDSFSESDFQQLCQYEHALLSQTAELFSGGFQLIVECYRRLPDAESFGLKFLQESDLAGGTEDYLGIALCADTPQTRELVAGVIGEQLYHIRNFASDPSLQRFVDSVREATRLPFTPTQKTDMHLRALQKTDTWNALQPEDRQLLKHVELAATLQCSVHKILHAVKDAKVTEKLL